MNMYVHVCKYVCVYSISTFKCVLSNCKFKEDKSDEFLPLDMYSSA